MKKPAKRVTRPARSVPTNITVEPPSIPLDSPMGRLVLALNDMQQKVVSGEITDIAISAVSANGSISSTILPTGNLSALLGAIVWTEHDLVSRLKSNQPE